MSNITPGIETPSCDVCFAVTVIGPDSARTFVSDGRCRGICDSHRSVIANSDPREWRSFEVWTPKDFNTPSPSAGLRSSDEVFWRRGHV